MSRPNIIRTIRFYLDDHLEFLADLGVGGGGLGLSVDHAHFHHRDDVGGVDDGAANVWARASNKELGLEGRWVGFGGTYEEICTPAPTRILVWLPKIQPTLISRSPWVWMSWLYWMMRTPDIRVLVTEF